MQDATNHTDIYGKLLEQFARRPDLDPDECPLIFHLLRGYFTTKLDKIQTLGIFRVTGNDTKINELKMHLCMGNYSFLNQVDDP